MLATLVAVLVLIPVIFLTCGGPTREEQIRDQADRIYTQISKQSPEKACQEIRDRLRRPGFVDIVYSDVPVADELFENVPPHDRDDVRREVDSRLRDPCRGQR